MVSSWCAVCLAHQSPPSTIPSARHPLPDPVSASPLLLLFRLSSPCFLVAIVPQLLPPSFCFICPPSYHTFFPVRFSKQHAHTHTHRRLPAACLCLEDNPLHPPHIPIGRLVRLAVLVLLLPAGEAQPCHLINALQWEGEMSRGGRWVACARHTAQQQQSVLAALHEALAWGWDDLQTMAADTQVHKCTKHLFPP